MALKNRQNILRQMVLLWTKLTKLLNWLVDEDDMSKEFSKMAYPTGSIPRRLCDLSKIQKRCATSASTFGYWDVQFWAHQRSLANIIRHYQKKLYDSEFIFIR